MGLDATIELLSEDFDLTDGTTTNFLVLRLSNGHSVRALISQEAAAKIVELTVGAAPPPSSFSDTAASSPMFSTERADAEVHVFGGTNAPATNGVSHQREEDPETGEEDAGQI